MAKSKNIIYGAGSCGVLFYNICKNTGFEIAAFVVSDGYKYDNQYDGIPIYELSELQYKSEECNIYVAVVDKNLKAVTNNLLKYDYNNIIILEYYEVLKILKKYYLNYFSKKNISILNDVIKCNEFVFINPFFESDDIIYSFLVECGDLILPEVFDEMNMMVDGLYNTEKVFLEEGDVVFDCGANIGLFSMLCAQKNNTVYAFEPIQLTFEYIKKISALYDNKIIPCNYALCDYIGETDFFVPEKNNLIGTMLLEQESDCDGKVCSVRCITIDEFVEKNNIKKLDFIKADIEGAERNMLLGAKNTLKTLAPKLAICTYHLKDDKEVLEDIIMSANPNYIVEHKWKKLYAYVPN